MIVFAAIVPHSPLLLPSIGKTHCEKLATTLNSITQLEQALYLSKPDTLCVIAPHAARYPDAFSINLAGKYHLDLKAFGDFSTTLEVKSDYLLIDRVQRDLRQERIPLTLSSSEELDYGFGVPLVLLTPHLKRWTLIPVSPSQQSGQDHFEFGRQLKRVLHRESKRVAVIASADLSHKVNETSPAGMVPEGATFDEKTRQAIESQNATEYVTLDPALIETSAQCGYRPIVTLLGVLDGLNTKAHVLSYEAPFGVGCLTAQFDIA